MQDLSIVVGHYSLLLALIAVGWSVAAALLGLTISGRGLQRSAERSIWFASGLTWLAAICLWVGFLTDDFRLDYVFEYSSSTQALPYKIGALWGGQAGSLLLWAMILCLFASIMIATNRTKNRVLMPWATVVVGVTMLFFMILLNFIAQPFATGPMRPDGVGLNPQLKNYWMMIHPPTLYVGYVGFTIPFAFGIAALITRRTGDIWFRTTRRWTIFSWFALGTGVLLGSYWAYIELGWGGYWAWDPVENASLMPWLTGTAFLHSVMIQEKKNMLRVWNMLLIILTFCLSIFGTFLTRSGIISSVHAFATSDIGPAFGTFLAIIFFASMFLLITRLDSLKSEARLESVVSRESTFLFNNLVLVGICATILLLTTFPILSEAVTGRKVTMGPPIFNLVNIPWALVLLLLMGIGPMVAWRRATRENLRKNLLIPAIAGLWVFLLMIVLAPGDYGRAVAGMGRGAAALNVAAVLDSVKAFYPAITFGFGFFVLAAMYLEYHRGARVRIHRFNESVLTAVGQLIWRNRRRYAGYIVHFGMVLIFFGIAGSSAYKKETVQVLDPGQYLQIEDYTMRYDGFSLEAIDDYVSTVTRVTLFDREGGQPLGGLQAEQRSHLNNLVPELKEPFHRARELGRQGSPEYPAAVQQLFGLIPRLEQAYRREVKIPSTEVGIYASWSPLHGTRMGEDFYVIPMGVDPATGRANFRVFVNPMVNFIWLGGLVFVLGSIVTILPDARERKRLEAALILEDRAVA